MKTAFYAALSCAFLLSPVAAGAAPLIGPVYPAPGGNSFSGSGSFSTGTRTATYSGFNLSASDELYWGMTDITLSMDGSSYAPNETLTFNSALSNLSAGLAVYSGTTTLYQFGSPTAMETRFTLQVTDTLGNALGLIPAASLGLAYGPMLDVQGDFKITQALAVRQVGSSGGFTPSLTYFNNAPGTNPGPQVYSSVSAGFYYTEAAVPEPATWGMMIGGLALAGFAMRRRPSTRISFS